MLKDTLREFVEKELRPIAGKLDKEHKFPEEQVSGKQDQVTPMSVGVLGNAARSVGILGNGIRSAGILGNGTRSV